jgi:hypothetical protein
MAFTAKSNTPALALSTSNEEFIAEASGEKVATTLTVTLPPDSPDGGTREWLQVAGSFIVFGNLWGMTFAFGTF